MARLLCWLFGHRWVWLNKDETCRTCRRCYHQEVDPAAVDDVARACEDDCRGA